MSNPSSATRPPSPDSASASAPESASAAADPARATTLPPRGLAAYLLVAFAFSWSVWGGGTALTEGGNPMALVIIGSFGPAVAAVAVTWALQGWSGVGALFRRYSPRRRGGAAPYVITAAVVLAIAASAAIPVLLAEASVNSAELGAAAALLPANVLLIAFAGGGNEELGWRGFMLPRLQGAMPPLAANVILGAVWAVWHAPLWTMPGTVQSQIDFHVYTMLVVGLTVVFGCVFNSSRGGLIAVVVAHTAVNAVAGLKVAALGEASGMGEAVLVALVAVILVLLTRGRLGLPRGTGADRR
ncbi:CAAX protease [Streptomonospora alba]|uniref:CAAX protease n=1 Tax=Streptomonospora alba TaxID=183763 RepID=A0A0C2G421_9ACTN|nr:type II CAAX endopeptidase family protein [Streptomonospora alba]KIH98013.1 CAAX protease [Streptomonospora alba]